ncbi:MAG TPA: RT0821/Lpp0805 family surface protein [Gammaproteobacteria bacterium]|nr:RT0821/Lpp0805 family surface protein [Gammaproteobacteria bacterium]
MKKSLNYLMLFLFMVVSMSLHAECQQSSGGGEILGTLAGAAIGGLVGSQFGSGTGKSVAIGAGVVAGGFLGNKIGKELSCKDQEYHYDTTQNALETQKTGQSSTWTNPDTGHSGEVTPTRTYTAADGTPCREFEQTIFVDGEYENIQGTACRQSDGTWKPVNG